jgi:putative folate metabolism gamma-glutamate ligase
MLIKPVKTKKIIPGKDRDIFLILAKHLPKLKERSVVVITSKIIAICEGRFANPKKVKKDELVKKESAFYLPRQRNKYGFLLTVKNNTLIASAGIDESNAAGNLILWPKSPQKSANMVRAFLKKQLGLKNVGVIITDSKLTPLRRGTTGVCIAHSGFSALNDYRGKPDVFGRKLKLTQANVAEGLASSAVALMGEGKEQTPIVVIENIPFVEFQSKNPSKKELAYLRMGFEEDVYGKILASVKWQKGKTLRS